MDISTCVEKLRMLWCLHENRKRENRHGFDLVQISLSVMDRITKFLQAAFNMILEQSVVEYVNMYCKQVPMNPEISQQKSRKYAQHLRKFLITGFHELPYSTIIPNEISKIIEQLGVSAK